MKRYFWQMVLLAVLPIVALGQAQTTGRISGTVVDDTGQPVAGASVTIANAELQLEREVTTEGSGVFNFPVLPVGEYSVTVTQPGYQPQVMLVTVGIGQTVPLQVALAPGGEISETMTVYAPATAMETTTTGESFSYDTLINELPITDRTLESVAAMAPNISFGPTGGTLAIAGAPSFDTTVLLDGAEVSDPYFGSAPEVYLEDAIAEVQVLTAGVSARYGRFQGGVVNAITKSGGNELEGSLRVDVSQESWNSTTPLDEQQSDERNYTYQAFLGGPVVQDRLWYFVGGRTIPETANSSLTVSTRENYETAYNEDRWQAKLNGAINESHMISVNHLDFSSESSNRAGLRAGNLGALGVRADPREVDALSYQGVLSASTFVDLQASVKQVGINSGGDPERRSPLIEYFQNLVFENGWWDASDQSVRDNQTVGVALSHFLESERWGSHELEGGLSWVNSTTGGENRQSPTGYNLLSVTNRLFAGTVDGAARYNLFQGGAYRWEALPLGGEQELENTALYLQDVISLDRWRFDLGLRYEQYEGQGPVASLNIDHGALAPRLGVTYELTPNWQLQAMYGRYVSRLNDNIGNDLSGVASAPRIETIYTGPTLLGLTADDMEAILRDDSNWAEITDFILPDQPRRFPANDLEAPYADDWTLSLRHALPRTAGSVVLTLVRREFNNLLEDFTGQVCSELGLEFERPCPDADYTRIEHQGLAQRFDTTVWSNSDLERTYDAATLTFDYRPLRGFSLGGNYTYSRLEGNYEGEGANLPSVGGAHGDYPRSQHPGFNPVGRLDEDIPHRINLWSVYDLALGRAGSLGFGAFFNYRSGFNWSRAAAVPYREVPEYLGEVVAGTPNTYTYVFTRGEDRLDPVWRLSTSAQYNLPELWRVRPWMKLVVQNVFDNDTVTGFSTAGEFVADAEGDPVLDSDGRPMWQPIGDCGPEDGPSASCSGFGRIRSELDYQAPRTFELSVGLRF